MVRSQCEIHQSVEQLKRAFPRLSDWRHADETDGSHHNFRIWAEYVADSDGEIPRQFFVTFALGEHGWSGCLSIGQHAYFWTSADFGDARLVDVAGFSTLAEATVALKRDIEALSRAFL